MSNSNRLLVKLLPTFTLSAANPQANLRPLFDGPQQTTAFGLGAAPAWFLADMPDGADTPWDLAHSQVANQLGIDESSVLFAEPDIEHQVYPDVPEMTGNQAFAIGENCGPENQTSDGSRAQGPDDVKFAWHLGEKYSQLDLARKAVQFNDRRTRIAHIDTGYDKNHASRPKNILTNLERNFVDSDGNPHDAQDPDNKVFALDNSGHGTGTLSVLAGREAKDFGDVAQGGAPDADIVPLRIADRVVLFRTSAFAQALRYATQQSCDVVSISMGGLPSRAWNEAVNEAYEAGVCICAAAGNNVNGLATRHVVYPARYRRVIAVCGVMADGRPYVNLTGSGTLEGNFGPASCMTAAISTYTPNIPWAKFGCPSAIRLNGEGTSAATPQVAAAVALWYEKYKNVLPRDWRRVEAVRKALFDSAKDNNVDPEHFGRGILQAASALAINPVLSLPKTPGDSDSFAFLRVLTGLGAAEEPREIMFNVELMQRWLLNKELQALVPDPDAVAKLPEEDLRKFMEAVIEDDHASLFLRQQIAGRYSLVFGTPMKNPPPRVVAPAQAACNKNVSISDPPFRLLRAYAVDPSLSTRLATASMNEVALKVRWEKDLKPGPTGEYLKVVDKDAAGEEYDPVDLNDPRLLAQDGLPPAEGNAGFHQQMVYAIAMRTIEHFERALGRPVLWRPRINRDDSNDDSQFVGQLEVRPHALRQANAFYSPEEMALLFGYFAASASDPGDHVPGSKVYACLSHDIVAHETTHAILDGMHRRFNEPSNHDVLAFHEAFADIVALMQHFTMPEIVENEISRTRGNLKGESILGSLALQFGRATGQRGALRDAIGRLDEKGNWRALQPDPADFKTVTEAHARGAILVAAVFEAFISIYETRTADLLRIYTGGTGVLPTGAIHPDLVRRLAAEASKTAKHILNMCIRALDYLPPVDVTFGEYLRGIITADADLVVDDRYNYRVAFVEAFRRRGIYPNSLDTLSVDTLRWDGVDIDEPPPQYEMIITRLKQYADACFYISDREILFHQTRDQRQELHKTLKAIFADTPGFASKLGIDPDYGFEVHALRRSSRVGPDGNYRPQVVVALTQWRPLTVEGATDNHVIRGGSTLIVDLSKPAVQYAIVKRILSPAREQSARAFLEQAQKDPLQALFVAPNRRDRFALLHSQGHFG
jgi:hypothetical protein